MIQIPARPLAHRSRSYWISNVRSRGYLQSHIQASKRLISDTSSVHVLSDSEDDQSAQTNLNTRKRKILLSSEGSSQPAPVEQNAGRSKALTILSESDDCEGSSPQNSSKPIVKDVTTIDLSFSSPQVPVKKSKVVVSETESEARSAQKNSKSQLNESSDLTPRPPKKFRTSKKVFEAVESERKDASGRQPSSLANDTNVHEDTAVSMRLAEIPVNIFNSEFSSPVVVKKKPVYILLF
jgi:hypothetical protein